MSDQNDALKSRVDDQTTLQGCVTAAGGDLQAAGLFAVALAINGLRKEVRLGLGSSPSADAPPAFLEGIAMALGEPLSRSGAVGPRPLSAVLEDSLGEIVDVLRHRE